jgi:ferredoxin
MCAPSNRFECTQSLPPRSADNYDGVKSVLEGVPMRVIVDYDACSSNAVCMGIAPEIFEVRDDGFMYVLNENPGPEFDERLREAVASCPNGALSLEE